MSDIRISILIASYNRPKRLMDLLMSIGQLNAGFEIVILDDCSCNYELFEPVRRYSLTNESVNFHSNANNLGEIATKKKLAGLAKGTWLIFLGDDDLVTHDFQIDLIKSIELHSNYDVILFGFRFIDENNKFGPKRGMKYSIQIPNNSQWFAELFLGLGLFPFHFFHPAYFLSKKERFLQLDFSSDVGFGEDYLHLSEMYLSGMRIVIDKMVPLYYRKNKKLLINTQNNQSLSSRNYIHTKVKLFKVLQEKYKNQAIGEFYRSEKFKNSFLIYPFLNRFIHQGKASLYDIKYIKYLPTKKNLIYLFIFSKIFRAMNFLKRFALEKYLLRKWKV